MSCELAVQDTIYNALVAALPDVGVYDEVSPTASFPYVTIGDDVSSEYNTATTNGWRTVVSIHSWGRNPGRGEVKGLQAQIYAALHRQELVIVGFDFMTCEFENSQSFLDADAKTRHGVQSFAIYCDSPLI